MFDPRKGNAVYYDLDESPLQDIPFYLQQLSQNAEVLELGCGTGRTLIPLAAHCKRIVGIDYSGDMAKQCAKKLPSQLKAKCELRVDDITSFDLKQTFDVILAPYRVFQALETDSEVQGFFASVRKHLKPNGFCILNVFKPKCEKDELLRTWAVPEEQIRWEKTLPDGSRVVHSEIYERINSDPLVIFPQLIYRKYMDNRVVDEFVLKIKMRCYYPEEFKKLIEAQGFRILDSWGGYAGEKYGEGKELVVKFSL